ncbi:hypothetical protein [Flavobacterium sp.]
MSKKDKKNQAEEPTENDQIEPKNEVQTEELHAVLVQLIDLGKEQSRQGLGKPHAQVMEEMKKKYNIT